MKRLPPRPNPDPKQIMLAHIACQREDLDDLVAKANEDYKAWDKVRYMPLPDNVPWEQFWAFLRSSRRTQSRRLPLRASDGSCFTYWLPDNCQRILHRIDLQLAGHVGFGLGHLVDNSDGERYLISSLMDEAINSSMLEGAVTTRAAAREMLRQDKPPRTHGERMVMNNYAAMQKARQFRKQPLSLEMIHELHAAVTKDDLPAERVGRFQQPGEQRVHVEDTENGEVIHQPPPAEETPARMEELIRFANDQSPAVFIHPVVKAIMLHFMISYIHPYEDGNGRTARALFYWSMLHSGYWLTEYLTVSQVICKSRQQYYNAFRYCELDDYDATYFIRYHLRAIEKAMVFFEEYLERKQAELRQISAAADMARKLNFRQRALLAHALKHKGATYTITSHRNSHGIGYQTARKDLLEMAEMGLLVIVQKRPLELMGVPGLKELLETQAST